MSLLELHGVTRRHRQGSHERVVLRDVSLTIDAGELVAVWGLRRCGRSTLLRVTAGIEPVDAGSVTFAGRALSGGSGDALGRGIGYCRLAPRDGEGRAVLDELIVAQLARGVAHPLARERAHATLERAGAPHCATLALGDLDGGETVRVTIARALLSRPSLLVIDDPVKGVDLMERDIILMLLRSLADEGIAVLISATEATALSGADRALSLSEGVLRGAVEPRLAPVVPLRRAASA